MSRVVPVLWTASITALAVWLSIPGGPSFSVPESVHVLAHVALFGVLASMLARITSLDRALGLTVLAGAVVELGQILAVGYWLDEAVFDVGVNGLGGVGGLLSTRRAGVDARAGLWLHPVVVAPAALFGTVWASGAGTRVALAWMAVAMVCVAPAVLVWAVGVRRGWYPHFDVIDASQRREIFAAGALCTGAYALAAWAWAPPAARASALALALGMVAVTGITRAGFKISGHVAVPLVLAAVAWAWTPRGAACLAFTGALLSVARVGAGRHRPVEVLASWGLAAAGALAFGATRIG